MTSATAVALAVLGSACGGDDSGGGDTDANAANEAIVAVLRDNGAPDDVVVCFAQQLSDFDAADIEAYFAAEGTADAPDGMLEAFERAAAECGNDEPSSSESDEPSTDGSSTTRAPGLVAIPGQEEIGTPFDDPIPFDVEPPTTFGTVTFGCSPAFAGHTDLPVRIADCTQVASALGEFVVVVATLDGSDGVSTMETWLACSSDAGGYVPVIRWVGPVVGLTPMVDDTVGAGFVVSMSDPEGIPYHLVLRYENAASACPTSTVEGPAQSGTGPIETAGGLYVPTLDAAGEPSGVCYRPEGDHWARGDASGSTC